MGKRTRNKNERHSSVAIWYLLGCIILLNTFVYSMHLIDASNIVRYISMTISLFVGSMLIALKKKLTSIPITLGTISFGIFVLFQGLSMIWATNFAEALFDVSKWVMILLTILISYNLFKWKPVHTIYMLSVVSAIAFVISSLVAFKQIADLNTLSWSDRYGIVSLFTHKGTYSMMLLLMLPFPIMRLRLRIKRSRILYILLIFGIFLMLLLLQSRAIIVALAAMLLCLVILRILKLGKATNKIIIPSKIIMSAIICIILVGGCRWFSMSTPIEPNNLSDMLSNTTIIERQALWQNSFYLADKSPFLGCGAGNWKICYTEPSIVGIFSVDILDRTFIRPHNEYLRVLSETGYIALFLLILAVSSIFLGSARINKGRYGLMSRIGMSFVASVLAFSLFDFPFDRIELILWTSLLVGCTASVCISSKSVGKNKIFWYGAASTMLFASIIGFSRWHSESLFVDITNDIHNSKWSKVEENSKKAHTIFCNISPMGIPYKYYEGMACEYQKKQSIDCFRAAAHDSPNSKQVLCDLGRLEYVVNNDANSAEKYLRKSIGISPSYSYPYFNLAEIMIKEQRYDEAIGILESLNLEQKQQKIDKMIWQYVDEKDTYYYINELVPAEEAVRQKMLSRIYAIKKQQINNNQIVEE